MKYAFRFGLILATVFGMATGSALAQHPIQQQINHLLKMTPDAPSGYVKDDPQLITPNVNDQHTFELQQIYYDRKSPQHTISIDIKDYSVNPDYFSEQKGEKYNKDEGNTVSRSDSLLGYAAQFFKTVKERRITLFLDDYFFVDVRTDDPSIQLTELEDFARNFPIHDLKVQIMTIKRLYSKASQ